MSTTRTAMLLIVVFAAGMWAGMMLLRLSENIMEQSADTETSEG